MIVRINFCVIKYKTKQKHLLPYCATNDKCKYYVDCNDKVKETDIKNRMCYHFNDIIKIDYNLDNILIDENHTKIL